MAQSVRNAELRAKTQRLLHGALRNVRAAALAAALVPLGSVAVSSAVAQDCGSGGSCASVPAPCDFVTSGGFVVADSLAMANFGAHGGCKKGAFWGHVNYVDHATDYHVNSTKITGYLTPFPGSKIRDICGVAETNGDGDESPVLFRLRLTDEGEPGSSDVFGIRLSNGYHVSTRLLGAGFAGGGNVELHNPNPSTVAPDPVPDELTMCGGVDAP